MASDFKNRAKEILSEAVLRKKGDSPQTDSMFLRGLALRPLIIVSLLLCAGVTYAAYRAYFHPRGEINAPAEGSSVPRIVEIAGLTKNIPPERHYIWLAVDVPELGLCWPKRQVYSTNDTFRAKIVERGPNTEFTVSLYAVPRNVHLDILDWIKDCRETRTETGFKMIHDRLRLDSVNLTLHES